MTLALLLYNLVNTARFLKYIWSFFNSTRERFKYDLNLLWSYFLYKLVTEMTKITRGNFSKGSALLHLILMIALIAQIPVQIQQKNSKTMLMEVAKVSLLLNLKKDLSSVLVLY